MKQILQQKALRIKLLITDCDGVLTDGGVYYGNDGEDLKKFNIRDGMGVERLRKLANVETAIITGEKSPSVIARAQKLQIEELHLFVKDKPQVFKEIIQRLQLNAEEVAYIGDDYNDLEIMQLAGLTAAPADALPAIRNQADYVCQAKGGEGCFREFAELIIQAKNDYLSAIPVKEGVITLSNGRKIGKDQ